LLLQGKQTTERTSIVLFGGKSKVQGSDALDEEICFLGKRYDSLSAPCSTPSRFSIAYRRQYLKGRKPSYSFQDIILRVD
jgi:hypothetical protein